MAPARTLWPSIVPTEHLGKETISLSITLKLKEALSWFDELRKLS
jgi:hypothetical protein